MIVGKENVWSGRLADAETDTDVWNLQPLGNTV